MSVVGQRIKWAREHRPNGQRPWNQSDLARALGVRPNTVSGWESGKSLLRAEMLIRIADVLGVRPGLLLGEEDTPPPDPVAAVREAARQGAREGAREGYQEVMAALDAVFAELRERPEFLSRLPQRHDPVPAREGS